MMNKIKAYDYRGKYEETFIPDDVEILIVKEITGDECIEMYRTEPEFGFGLEWVDDFDPFGFDRTRDCLDALYVIHVYNDEEFTNWNEKRIKPKNRYIKFDDIIYSREP